MQALQRAAERRFPAWRVEDARQVEFVSETHFVTWARDTDKDILRLWDTRQRVEFATYELPRKVVGASHVGGRLFIVGGFRPKLLSFSAQDLTLVSELRLEVGPGRIALSPDGRVLALMTRSGDAVRGRTPFVVFFRGSSDGTLLHQAPLGDMTRDMGMAFSGSGRRLVVVGGTLFEEEMELNLAGSCAITVLDASDGSQVLRDKFRGRPNFLFARGETFLTGTVLGRLFEYDAAIPKRTRHFVAPDAEDHGMAALRTGAMAMGIRGAVAMGIRGAVITHDGKRMFTVSGEPLRNMGAMAEWDMQTGERLSLLEGLKGVVGVTLSPDGEWLALPCTGGGVELWHAR